MKKCEELIKSCKNCYHREIHNKYPDSRNLDKCRAYGLLCDSVLSAPYKWCGEFGGWKAWKPDETVGKIPLQPPAPKMSFFDKIKFLFKN